MKQEYFYKFIKVFLFLFLLLILLFQISYILRPPIISNEEKVNLLSYYQEPKDTLDMLFIGSSDVIVYWMPYKAYEEIGITSFAYGRSAIRATMFDALLDEVLNTQTPSLVVVGLRTILETDETIAEVSIRNVTDVLPFTSFSRWKMITDNKDKIVLTDNSIEKNGTGQPEKGILSLFPFYFDIMKYHENWHTITKSSFTKITSENSSKTKGFLFKTDKAAQIRDENIPKNSDTSPLNENSEKTIINLMKKAEEKNFDLLFVLVPYCETKGARMKYNEAKRIIENFGGKCIDFNEYFDEIGLDTTEDFYNSRHINILGAEKFTSYFTDYLIENYNLPDHRGEKKYQNWAMNLIDWKELENKNIIKCSEK